MKMLFAVAVAVVVFLFAGGVAGAVTVGWKSPTHLQVVLGDGEEEKDLELYVVPLRALCFTDPNGRNYVGSYITAMAPAGAFDYELEEVQEDSGVSEVWISPVIYNVNVHHFNSFVGEFEVSRFEYRISDPESSGNNRAWERRQNICWMYCLTYLYRVSPRLEMRAYGQFVEPTVEVMKGKNRRVVDVGKLCDKTYHRTTFFEVKEEMEPPDSFFVR